MSELIVIYTDGASKGNPGAAGWGCLVGEELYSGGLDHATNNYAELFAVYKALEVTPANSVVLIVTDSKLVRGWLALNWNMKVEAIRQIVSDILAVKQAKNISWAFKIVKGHSTNEKNNLVDLAASNAAHRVRLQGR